MNRLAVIGLAIATTLPLAATGHAQTAQFQFPKGGWTFSHRPYVRPGADALPVRVTSVKGEAQRLQIWAVAIENLSGKTVSELRLGWYLTRGKEQNRILASGITPAVFPLSIAPGGTHRGDVPVMTFADHYQPFVEKGQLTGDFSIEVAVVEVRYADGTSWKAEGLPTIAR